MYNMLCMFLTNSCNISAFASETEQVRSDPKAAVVQYVGQDPTVLHMER